MSDLLQIGGLWKNTSANGDMYLQGKLGPNVRILIFKNKYKTADNQPDYQMYFAPVERRDEGVPGDGDPDFLTPDEQLNGREQRPAPRPQQRAQGGGPRQGDRLPAPPRAGGGTRRRNTPEPGFDDDDTGDLADPFAE